MRNRRLLIPIVFVALLGATILVSMSASAGTSSAIGSGPVSALLPGATVRTEPGPADAEHLAISLPGGDSGTTVDPTDANFWTAEVRWRAAMATAVTAEQNPQIVGFQVDPGIEVAEADNSLAPLEVIKENPAAPTLASEQPRLGSVGLEEAKQQLQSNADMLLSADLAVSVDLTPITIDDGWNAVALVAVVNVTKLPSDEMGAFLGNVLNGMSTGLVSGEGDLIDGLAVIAEANDAPVAASFYSSRAGTTQMLAGNGVTLPGVLQPTLEFKNLTGGPPTQTTLLQAPPRIVEDASP